MTEPYVFEFGPGDTAAVVAEMAELDRDRNGWVNLQPAADTDPEPAHPPGLMRFFGGKGPEIPLATWVPGERRRQGTEPTTIGVQHASGPRAAARLVAAGLPPGEGWRVVQDHPRRGLVIALPADAGAKDVVDWLLRAGAVLATVPLTGQWRAAVYRTG